MEQIISLADPQKNLVSQLGIVGVEVDKKTAPMLQGSERSIWHRGDCAGDRCPAATCPLHQGT